MSDSAKTSRGRPLQRPPFESDLVQGLDRMAHDVETSIHDAAEETRQTLEDQSIRWPQ